MAVISMFYGIIVSMYYGDNRQHHLPHIHAKYQNYEAVFSIPDGKIIDGKLPSNKVPLVEAWIILHVEELLADWELASHEQNVFKIEPLR